MTSVGATLRSVRERQGRAVSDVAEELCLTEAYIRAIEKDDLKSLPGTFFYKSFVKQYATVLGMNPAELRAGIDVLTPVVDPADPPIAAPSALVTGVNRRYFSSRSFSDKSMGGAVAGLVAVVVACSFFYAWWQKPVRAVASQPPTPSVQPLVQPLVQPAVIHQASAESPQILPIPEIPIQAVISTSASDGVNRVALNLSATEKTWLSVSSGGKQIFSGVLEPSETKTLTGLNVAQMKVGNAGGIEVQWNGKPIGPIGPRGQVRVVEFTPDHFEILPTNPLPSPESL